MSEAPALPPRARLLAGETTWELPESLSQQTASPPRAASVVEEAHSPWLAAVDPDTGMTYYYHETTGRCTVFLHSWCSRLCSLPKRMCIIR